MQNVKKPSAKNFPASGGYHLVSPPQEGRESVTTYSGFLEATKFEINIILDFPWSAMDIASEENERVEARGNIYPLKRMRFPSAELFLSKIKPFGKVQQFVDLSMSRHQFGTLLS